MLLLQQQRLEILWYRRGRVGGSCTRWIVVTFPEPRVSFLLGILGVWHSGQTGISAPMLSRGNRIRRQRKHGNCVSGQAIAKLLEYVAVMSVGSPGVVLWHVVCPKLCCALPKASHLTIVTSLCCPMSDYRSSAFSEVLTGCSSCIGSKNVRLAMPLTLTHRLFSQSRASSQGFFSCPSVPYRDSVSVLSVSSALWPDAEAIHECILFCLKLSHAAR